MPEREDVDKYEITVEKAILLPTEEWLEARLVDVTSKTGKYGPLFQFTFRLVDEKYEDVTLTGQMNKKVNSNQNTKSYRWYSGLVGHDIQEGETINVKKCVSSIYEIFIENKKGENKVFQNVTRIRAKEGISQDKPQSEIKTESKATKEAEKEDIDISEDDIPF